MARDIGGGGWSPPKNEAARLSRGGEARPDLFSSSTASLYSASQTGRQPLAILQPAAARRLRRQRLVERLCRVPRLIAELLDEIARHHGIGEDLDRRLERYAGLDPELLTALGGDKFPATPIRAVGGGR